MKTKRNKYSLMIVLPFFLFTLVSGSNSQIKNEKSIYCEQLKNLLIKLSARNYDVLATREPSNTVIVVSPGNKKSSNTKTAQKLIRNIKLLDEKQLSGNLRSVIVETKQIKGNGRFQIYFYDEIYDFPFDEGTFECP